MDLATRLALAVTLLGSGALSPVASARDGFTATGAVRLRYEGLSGQSRAGFKADDQYVSARTILTGEYTAGRWRLAAELYDSRAWLADARSAISTGEVDALEFAQSYAALTLDDALGRGSKLAAQAGRFTMNLGSRRLVAADDYRNTTNSFTGARLDATLASGWTLTTLYTLPVTRLPDTLPAILDNDVALDDEDAGTRLWGGLVTTPRRVAGGALELLYLDFQERDTARRPTRDRALGTWNLRWFREPAAGQWDYEFEYARQQGRASTGTAATAPRQRVDADFRHARLGYQWNHRWKPRLALEWDRASGDRAAGRIGRYDTLFGSRRSDLAPSGLYNQLTRANLESPGLRVELSPGKRFDAMATWRLLRLASATDAFANTGVRDASGRSGRDAGRQFDLRLRYWAVPQRLRLECDGLWLDKGRFLVSAPNARPGDTRFLSLNASFSF